MKKHIIAILISCAFVNYASAHDYDFCHTRVSAANQYPGVHRGERLVELQNTPLYVRVFFHIIRNSNGNGLGIASADLMEQRLNILNNDFNTHNIFFKYMGFDYIDNDGFYALSTYDSTTYNTMISTNRHEDAINIYLLPTNGNFSGGLAEDIPGKAIAVGNSILHNGVNMYMGNTRILSHEIGHCLGLYHTFQGYNIVGTNNGFCSEFVDGSNCEICGDFVCDTPADAFPDIKSLISYFGLTCDWVNTLHTDGHGDLYSPDFSLIMSYNFPDCMTHFTHGQGERMRDFLLHSTTLNSVVHNYNLKLQNETFTNDTALYGIHSITAGRHVTDGEIGDVVVNNGSYVKFISEGTISLMPGFKVRQGGRFVAKTDQSSHFNTRAHHRNTKRQYLSMLQNDSWMAASLGYEGETFIDRFVNTHKDTLINGESYICIEHYAGQVVGEDISYYRRRSLYFAEETLDGKVYEYSTTDQVKKVLFDFGLNVGDTFPNVGTAEKIDVININGINRKKIVFNNKTNYTTWIEGIGSISLGLYPYYADTTWNHLVCVANETNVIYEHPFKGLSCNIFTSTSPTATTNFSLSPNPTINELKVNISIPINTIAIYNLNGQCVLQTNETDIDVSSLPQGMYILRAETSDGVSHQAKFIKE